MLGQGDLGEGQVGVGVLHVVLEVGELGEALHADGAEVGLLARVDEAVTLKLGGGGKAFAAVRALVPLHRPAAAARLAAARDGRRARNDRRFQQRVVVREYLVE